MQDRVKGYIGGRGGSEGCWAKVWGFQHQEELRLWWEDIYATMVKDLNYAHCHSVTAPPYVLQARPFQAGPYKAPILHFEIGALWRRLGFLLHQMFAAPSCPSTRLISQARPFLFHSNRFPYLCANWKQSVLWSRRDLACKTTIGPGWSTQPVYATNSSS